MPRVYRKNCEFCGIWYESWAKRFCSNSCATKWKHKSGYFPYRKWSKLPKKICPICDIIFKPIRSKDKYCSKQCYYKSISVRNAGSNHPMWKGGKTLTNNGYVLLSIGGGKQRLEHRIVMEKHLGRKLKKTEHVHHDNGNKIDNRIENLTVLDTSEHNRLHAIKQWSENGSLRNR